jgi:DNA-binding NtrC family response regulator
MRSGAVGAPATLPVLLIEDEPSVMALVSAALERNGYPVVCIKSAAEALEVLGHQDFLGVISDMRTPGGVDGADVYDWVVAHRPALASRMVLVTGDIANEETQAKLRRTGAPCVEKPFRVQQLMSVVKRVMGSAS